ncbi:dystroglycan 1 isoform X2 [Battus philenor]|uniref:dystroglycan 1 isoform X2 n=1 Tax=Battus philenor TaxID=42288 RepID=UPI0035D05996
MTRARALACALLVLCPLAIGRNDDDFDFDNNEEFQVELTANHSEIEKNGLRRLWGVPDTSAYVGHLFRMEIPKEAFSGDVVAYKVYSKSARQTPSWLAVDSRHGLISGLPQREHLGAHGFAVVAHGHTRGLTATDYFTIEVKNAEEKPQSKYGSCRHDENRLVLVTLIDGAFHRIPPRQRIRALMDLATFMALDGDEFWMEPYKAESARTHTVLMSGAGTTQRRRNDATTAIYLNVGCRDKLWTRHKVLVAGLREQSRDGTLAHILNLPVLGWRLVAVKPHKPVVRPKRQSSLDSGSGAGVYDTYDGEDDVADYSGDYDDDDDNEDDFNIDSLPESVVNKVKITPYTETVSEAAEVDRALESNVVESRKLGHSPVIISPEDSSTTSEPELQTVIIRASNEVPPMSSEPPTTPTPSPPPSPSPSPPSSPFDTIPTETTTPSTTSTTESTTTSTTTTSTTTTTTTTTMPTTIATSPTIAPTTAPSTTPTALPTTTPVPETTLQEVTKQDFPLSSERSSTIIGRTTETVTFPMPVNQPPTLKYHMKKLAITAGKAFRYIIPADLFTDPEEGTNLTFTMYDSENVPLSKNSWIQFIPAKREVYGLPLESHVSRWNFIVEAQDSEGLVARGPLDITVQQHKSGRTINHQFVMEFKLTKDYSNAIDWQIRALEGIVNLFRDTDMDHLTVLNATDNGDLCEYVWTNDTLPKDPSCPMDDINRLMKIMESETESGSPSAALARAMSPELKVSAVRWRGAGRCAAPPRTRPRPPDTYPPVTRNQVDHLTATVGHLLIYKVPEDTFFDPEDGGTRNLALSLRRSDRSELPPTHWLQFDARNQEFYGLPSPSDEGTMHYQLIAEDSSKKSAYDSLIVEVAKAPTIRPTVEFHMTLEYPYASLANNANNKRKVVEKLAALFEQKETDNIRIQSITDGPTTIIWYNTSLPMDRCPKKEIEELRKMIIVDERGSVGGNLRERVDHIFDKDFKVMSIGLISQGLCAEQNTKTSKGGLVPVNAGTNLHNSKATSAADPEYSDYLVTFVIPAVVIVCMILVAGVIACVLYKRRRTGKMSVGDEEERQAFRSKGIPVIFQDELEERADAEPVHKSPVIMREEKPPLLPPAPEYRTGEDAPYRPPPPFAASRTPPRPKATPTYRKPPPYVPP